MTAFERIRENPRMAALMRAAAGKKKKGNIDIEEYKSFMFSYLLQPLEHIQRINTAVAGLQDNVLRQAYARESVMLEAIVEQDFVAGNILRGCNRIKETSPEVGIPEFIYDGFIDMGYSKKRTDRKREKIVIDKRKLADVLMEAKALALPGSDGIVEEIYWLAKSKLRYDKKHADKMAEEANGGNIGLDKYLAERAGVCRHFALLYQLLAQEAGINSRIVKGIGVESLHVWNIAQRGGGFYLVDASRMLIAKSREAEIEKDGNCSAS